ncbi:hypothetical protein GCM10017083_27260 [Thalassobaculum fulvum]|uniref:nitric oxide dioxygenase n=1 Tax=Thalassobaculum fulvum TaxID=1633335 RepID=A0A918XSD0_9PROT|nr:pyridoxamine 5'-phosphate oxidase family protein [Thalassobaculum fulvum]GHD52077.1 hypothetical protein GCM10017083_27260 [Thalassobaculum fulvum]
MTKATAPLPGWPGPDAPIHEGEIALQERAGVRARADRFLRHAIRDYMPDQHRAFFAELPFLVVGSLDRDDRPWASILTGRPGFLDSPDPQTLTIRAVPAFGDPLGEALAAGAQAVGVPVGLLGLQPETRRRNRMNGIVEAVADGTVTVRVSQSFGNCPQYIQARTPRFVAEPEGVAAPRPVHHGGTLLDDRSRELVERADTFFIASAAPGARTGDPVRGVDVSHRGGRPGFVRIAKEGGVTVLTVPDFLGNFFFNTLGNIALNPAAGLLFVDFETGDALMLSGEAEVVWDGREVAAFAGAERLLRFRLRESRRIERAVPLRWSAAEPAPQLDATGTWAEAERALAADSSRRDRPFRIARIVDESATARSFHLEPADGNGVAPYRPGQFLPIALDIPGEPRPVRRTYTLSDAPDGRGYRITVKREADGLASRWLHDGLREGDGLRAARPAGGFVLDTDSRRPVLLLSAGIGVTPMIAMLNHLLGGPEGRRRSPHRRVWFVHAARHGGEHPFRDHLREMTGRHPEHLTVHVRYTAPRPQDVPGRDFDGTGRIDRSALGALLPSGDTDVYLCGPAGFMADMRDALAGLGVRPDRIRSEAFGPAGASPAGPSVERSEVTFRTSGVTATWTPQSGSLLDLAEAHGIDAPASCRAGSCGSCAAALSGGSVRYLQAPAAVPAAGRVLLCQALPTGPTVSVEL